MLGSLVRESSLTPMTGPRWRLA